MRIKEARAAVTMYGGTYDAEPDRKAERGESTRVSSAVEHAAWLVRSSFTRRQRSHGLMASDSALPPESRLNAM
ncbi:MAG: hypothetical protein RL385_5604 [Pseudomonadota bacterium]